jgi:acetyl-CoA carboxylase beta subunit
MIDLVVDRKELKNTLHRLIDLFMPLPTVHELS